jgi:hypothetical protein
VFCFAHEKFWQSENVMANFVGASNGNQLIFWNDVENVGGIWLCATLFKAVLPTHRMWLSNFI